MANNITGKLLAGWLILLIHTSICWASSFDDPEVIGETAFLIEVLDEYKQQAADKTDELEGLDNVIEDIRENLVNYQVTGVFRPLGHLEESYTQLRTLYDFMDLEISDVSNDSSDDNEKPNQQFKKLKAQLETTTTEENPDKDTEKYLSDLSKKIEEKSKLRKEAKETLANTLREFNSLESVAQLGLLKINYEKNLKLLQVDESILKLRLYTAFMPKSIKKLTKELIEVRDKKKRLGLQYHQDKDKLEQQLTKSVKDLEKRLQNSIYGLENGEPQDLVERFKKSIEDYDNGISGEINRLKEQQEELHTYVLPGNDWMHMASVTAPMKELLRATADNLFNAMALIERERYQLKLAASEEPASNALKPPTEQVLNLLTALHGTLRARHQLLENYFYPDTKETPNG